MEKRSVAAFKNRIFIVRTRSESNRNRQASHICRVCKRTCGSRRWLKLIRCLQRKYRQTGNCSVKRAEEARGILKYRFLKVPHIRRRPSRVLPQNSGVLIERVFQRFGLNGDEQILISGRNQASHLPLERPVHVKDLFQHCVELQEPAARAQIRELAAHTVCPPHQRELEDLLKDDVYKNQVLKKRLTMLDLLEQYPACELPFARFLALLPPLKPRYYSISSSPQLNPRQTSITVSVVSGPALSGRGQYKGSHRTISQALRRKTRFLVSSGSPSQASGFLKILKHR